MKKKHSPFFTKSKMKHLISDAGHSLPGIFLCALFLSIMTAVTGKVCPARLLLGIPCPGCGLTRAAVLLLKGDFRGSLLSNPFLLPLLAGGLLFLYEHYILERKARLFSACIAVCIFLMVVFYLIRMKYWFPNRPPMIYEPQNLLHLLFTALKSRICPRSA